MKIILVKSFALAWLVAAQVVLAAVSPVVGDYGEVFPMLTEQNLAAFRTGDPPPWFVTFNLLTTADVTLGAQQLSGNAGAFNLISMRLVTNDGGNVSFGTDTFSSNPFPSSIKLLATKSALPPGHYAVAISGTGDAVSCTPYCGDAPDFVVRIQITPSSTQPQPPEVVVSPVVGDFGDVFPTLTEQSIAAFRTGVPPPWFVTFNLLAAADVSLGAQQLSGNAGAFDLTSIRLVTNDGVNVAFGTDTFAPNPFPSSIAELVRRRGLPAGRYALAISGSGDARSCTPYCGDAPDFTARIQVLPSTGSEYSRNYVQIAYVAYYGRPADPDGQTYWALRMDAEGQALNAIIEAFGHSEEFTRRYGDLNNTQLVTKIYQQLLGRDPDPIGLAYYVDQLDRGLRTLQSITLDVLNGATTAPDATVVENKLNVAAYYTAKVAVGCPYGTEQEGWNRLSGVTANAATVAQAKVSIDSKCGT